MIVMTKCEVCCESFNKSTRTTVECPYCPFTPCTTCAERYLCETPDDAHCMSCRKAWSREILVNNFTQKFVTRTYKDRREDLLFEREKSLMPATLPYVENEKEIRKINRQIAQLRSDRNDFHIQWTHVISQSPAVVVVKKGLSSELEGEIEIHRQTNELRKIISGIQCNIEHLEWVQNKYFILMNSGGLEKEKRQFVRACPHTDCRGFLSTAWKCGVCDNWTCPECHEVKGLNKDDQHACDPNNIATARLLAKDSRNCPKCASLIFKINGCDQMYCTQCHTPFSWRTGRVEVGTIHNPHYYEYMRSRGALPRNPGDVPCGGFPDWTNLRMILTANKNRGRNQENLVTSAHRIWGHVQNVVLARYNVNAINDNRDLRIKFILNDISEDEFKRKIQQREKARNRKTDIRQVLEMFSTVLIDLFQAYVNDQDINKLVNSLNELRTHVNSTFTVVSKRFGKCAVPSISEYYDIL